MRELGIGLIGTGFMGRAHALAFRNVSAVFELPVRLHLAALPTQDTDASRLTTLEIEKDGTRQAIAVPKEMDGYTAVGLACVQDRSGTPYFVVQYGELPFGCSFCEWYYLYDASGRQLTHSTPPLRGTEGDEQEPNNDEYEKLIDTLGIKHPEVNYIED